MSAQRKLIREKIKEMLVGETLAGSKVFENRFLPYFEKSLPAISVYTISEASVIHNTAPRRYERTVKLVVEVAVKAVDDIDDKLDLICSQVEVVLHTDDTLGGVCEDFTYTGNEITINQEGDYLVAAARMQYDAIYYTDHGVDPDTLTQINKWRVHYTEDENTEGQPQSYNIEDYDLPEELEED